MKILNFGSLNIDHVYTVDHFVRPGETLSSQAYHQFVGGKGCNQSIALAHAGAEVYHAGRLGADGAWLRERLARSGVDTSLIALDEGACGHAIIQVNAEGENCIILHGGANLRITEEDAARTISEFGVGDMLLLQNEISAIPAIMALAAERSLRIVFNPAPMHDTVRHYPLELVSSFVVNEVEGADLTGETVPETILARMRTLYPSAETVLTLGARGALYAGADIRLEVAGERVATVDSTAAGDTFIGYYVAGVAAGADAATALRTACRAAAVCVTRPGAADSIPKREELR